MITIDTECRISEDFVEVEVEYMTIPVNVKLQKLIVRIVNLIYN